MVASDSITGSSATTMRLFGSLFHLSCRNFCVLRPGRAFLLVLKLLSDFLQSRSAHTELLLKCSLQMGLTSHEMIIGLRAIVQEHRDARKCQ